MNAVIRIIKRIVALIISTVWREKDAGGALLFLLKRKNAYFASDGIDRSFFILTAICLVLTFLSRPAAGHDEFYNEGFIECEADSDRHPQEGQRVPRSFTSCTQADIESDIDYTHDFIIQTSPTSGCLSAFDSEFPGAKYFSIWTAWSAAELQDASGYYRHRCVDGFFGGDIKSTVTHYLRSVWRKKFGCPAFHVWKVRGSGEFDIGCEHKNELPVFAMSASVVFTEGTFNVTLPDAYDPDVYPQKLTYKLASGSGMLPPGLSLSSSGVLSGTPGYDSQRTYSGIAIEVTDGLATVRSNDFTINVNNTNLIPLAAITGKASVVSGETVSLSGASSRDVDVGGNIVSYSWAQVSGPAVVLSSSTSQSVSFVAPAVTAATTITLRLSVTDNDGGVGSTTITVNIAKPPAPPVATIEGGDRNIQPGDIATLNGGASDADSPASAIIYQWTQVGGPSTPFVVDSSDTSILTVTAPEVDRDTEFQFQLSVIDDQPLSIEDAQSKAQVTVRVVPFATDETQESKLCGEGDDEVVSPYDNGGNPISHASGNKYQIESDYVGVGPLPLVFERHYNSQRTRVSYIGINWRHTYDRAVERKGNSVKVYRPEGGVVPFTLVGSVWQSVSANTMSLKQVTSGAWELTSQDDSVESYDSEGKLVKITDRAGFSLDLTYYPSTNKLQRVIDRFGRALNLEYYADSGLLFKVTDPAGKEYIYGYNNQSGNLTSITYPDKTSIQYLYENVKYVHALTGIKDGKGVKYASYEYDDATGRATRSVHIGGVNDTKILLNNGVASVTDALGQSRTFSSISNKGLYRTTGTQGPRCLHCAVSVKETTYDANGYPDTVTDFNDYVTDFSYDSRGLETKRIEALTRGTSGELLPTSWTRTIETQWHPTFRLPTCVIEAGRTASSQYSTRGQLTSLTLVDTSDTTKFATAQSRQCADIAARSDYSTLKKRVWTYTYYPTGLLTGLIETIDGPRTDVTDVTKFYYDVLTGNLSEIVDPLQHSTLFLQYDKHGRVEITRDPNNLYKRLSYDDLGRVFEVRTGTSALVKDISSYDELTRYAYDVAANDFDIVTLPDGSFIDYDYDGAHRLTDIRDQRGNHIHYDLDALGNKKKVDVYDPQNTLRRTHEYVFSTLNLLTESRGAATPTQVTKFVTYDANGAPKVIEDPEQKVTSYDYDAYGRVWKKYDPKNGTEKPTVYGYDEHDRLLSVQDPRGNTTQYTYDGLGNLVKVVSPDSGTVEYTEYDDAGNLKKRVDPRLSINQLTSPGAKRETTYQYDALSRLSSVTYDSDKGESYTYDLGVNGIGRLHTVVDSTGTTTFSYDLHGRLTEKKSAIGGVTLTVGYGYTKGKLTSVTYPSGTSVRYVYVNGEVQSITVNAQNLMTNMAYDPFGPLSSWSWSNGTAISRNYDLDGQLSTYVQGNVSRELKYFPAGSVQKISDVATGANAQTYTYDELYQLLTFDGTLQSRVVAHRYEHDGVGNRISVTLDGAVYSYTTPPESNKLQSYAGPRATTNAYDNAGNLTSDGVNTYQYDDRNRLVSVNNGPVRNGINAFGQRVYKIGLPTVRPGDANGDGFINVRDLDAVITMILGHGPVAGNADCTKDLKVTVQDLVCVNNLIKAGDTPQDTAKIHFAYDEAGQLLGEYDITGKPVQENVYFGGMPVAVLQNNQTYFVHADHLGTPRAVIDTTNKIVWRWDSDPFGTTAPNEDPDADNIKFTYNARYPGQYYDKETGLHYNYFRTYDPQTGRYLEADPIGLSGGLNLYTYVNAAPLDAVDKVGLISAGPASGQVADEIEPFTPIGTAKDVYSTYKEYGFAAAVGAGLFEANPAVKFAKRIYKACTTAVKEISNSVGRAGRQARLRDLASDDKLGSADRGWIKQEINSIERGQRSSIRNPPGKDLAHERGREAAKGYDYDYSNLQDRDLHRLQHKYDDFGRANAERPPE